MNLGDFFDDVQDEAKRILGSAQADIHLGGGNSDANFRFGARYSTTFLLSAIVVTLLVSYIIFKK